MQQLPRAHIHFPVAVLTEGKWLLCEKKSTKKLQLLPLKYFFADSFVTKTANNPSFAAQIISSTDSKQASLGEIGCYNIDEHLLAAHYTENKDGYRENKCLFVFNVRFKQVHYGSDRHLMSTVLLTAASPAVRVLLYIWPLHCLVRLEVHLVQNKSTRFMLRWICALFAEHTQGHAERDLRSNEWYCSVLRSSGLRMRLCSLSEFSQKPTVFALK